MKENPLLRLHRILSTRFNDEEFRTLCDLHIQEVKYDDLGGAGLADKARELITYFDRRGRFRDLVETIRTTRPDISLDGLEDFPSTETVTARKVKYAALGGIVAIALMSLVILLFMNRQSANNIPPVSLVGLSYTVDDWNTRSVDLRTASDGGIGVNSQGTLRFSGLWLSIPADAPGYQVYAEFYSSNDGQNPIGVSKIVPLKAGTIELGDVLVKNYGSRPGAWLVQEDWDSITIVLITKRDTDVVERNRYLVKFNPQGHAWFQSPPNVSFASIVYAIDDGPDQVLDFRAAKTRGIEAAQPFTLTLREVWYNANDGRENSDMTFYAYLTTGGYNESTKQWTNPINIQDGIQQVQPFKPMSWAVPADFVNKPYYLVVYWIRNDGAAMNTIDVPIRFSP